MSVLKQLMNTITHKWVKQMIEMETKMIPLSEIEVDDDFNCRGETITPADVYELMGSIKAVGQLAPVLLKPSKSKKYKYFLFAGFRRFAAIKFLGRTEIEAKINYTITDEEAEHVNLAENIKRRELNIVQEARGLRRFYLRNMTVEAIANMFDVGRDWVNVRLALLRLPEDIQHEAASGILNQKAIKELLPVFEKDPEKAYKMVAAYRDKKKGHEKKSMESHVKKTKVITERKIRQMSEIFVVQDCLLAHFGYNLASRAMAWAISEISTFEFMEDVQREADLMDMPFAMPQQFYEPQYKTDKVQDDC